VQHRSEHCLENQILLPREVTLATYLSMCASMRKGTKFRSDDRTKGVALSCANQQNTPSLSCDLGAYPVCRLYKAILITGCDDKAMARLDAGNESPPFLTSL
jgi:hypothetical protein